MPEPTRLKVIGNAIANGLAAYGTAPLANCAVRYGPQHSFHLAAGEVGAVIVRWASLNPEGLVYSGNAWQEWPVFIASIYVPDDVDAPATAEDLRTDIVDDIMAWMQSNRTITTNVTALHATTCEALEEPGLSDTEQVFRSAGLALTCHRIRS